MKIEIMSIGQQPPHWVKESLSEYAKRMPAEYHFTLTEIPLAKRQKNISPVQARAQEGQRLLAAIPANSYVVALNIAGQAWSTEMLAEKLTDWRANHEHVSLLIGGPDGLDSVCLQRANCQWSLSNLTFPHMLVRVIVAEQLYRAHCILSGHPYHR